MTHTARDGWKWVPVEATEEMIAAPNFYATTAQVYRAMVTAAPSPPSEVTREENKIATGLKEAILHNKIANELERRFAYIFADGNIGASNVREICIEAASAVLSLFHQRGEKG